MDIYSIVREIEYVKAYFKSVYSIDLKEAGFIKIGNRQARLIQAHLNIPIIADRLCEHGSIQGVKLLWDRDYPDLLQFNLDCIAQIKLNDNKPSGVFKL